MIDELINMCGENFEKLVKEKDQWRAVWYDNVTEISGYGENPEEALQQLVSRLKGVNN